MRDERKRWKHCLSVKMFSFYRRVSFNWRRNSLQKEYKSSKITFNGLSRNHSTHHNQQQTNIKPTANQQQQHKADNKMAGSYPSPPPTPPHEQSMMMTVFGHPNGHDPNPQPLQSLQVVLNRPRLNPRPQHPRPAPYSSARVEKCRRPLHHRVLQKFA
jgi:hypothetical protein